MVIKAEDKTNSQIDTSGPKVVEMVNEEPWMKSYWRPAMAWLYMAICAFDFIIAPILTMFISGMFHFSYVPWKSITLDNGGMIHFAFGAILGIAAWTRGAYEKRFTGNQ